MEGREDEGLRMGGGLGRGRKTQLQLVSGGKGRGHISQMLV